MAELGDRAEAPEIVEEEAGSNDSSVELDKKVDQASIILPSPGEGSQSHQWAGKQPPADLWEKLKPLARQMRHEPTPQENRLWQQLRRRQRLGLKFRRQHAIERFIVDFYCPKAWLVIEVDGPVHRYTYEEDMVRQEYLESLGLTVLRFTNEQVAHQLEGVVAVIDRALLTPPPAPPHDWGGEKNAADAGERKADDRGEEKRLGKPMKGGQHSRKIAIEE